MAARTVSFIRNVVSAKEIPYLLCFLLSIQKVSGQKVNLHKSSVTFSRNISSDDAAAITNLLGVAESTLEDRYLGLPTHIARSKQATFQFIEDKLVSRLHQWKSKALSLAAKEILLKSVANVLPNYAMLSFRIPSTSCRRLNGHVARFWWAQQDRDEGMKWASWRSLCRPKIHGGLGFRDFDGNNIALLAKQAWRILHSPDCALAVLYKAKYFPQTSFLQAVQGARPSWAWQGVLLGRDLLLQGLRWLVGSGTQIHITNDCWLPTTPPSCPKLLPHAVLPSTQVSSLIDHSNGSWKMELLQSLFDAATVKVILMIPLPQLPMADKCIWHYEPSGEYSVKTGYHVAASEFVRNLSTTPIIFDSRAWKALWALSVPPKLRFFLWRLIKGFLPVRDVLRDKELIEEDDSEGLLCPVCS
ncbi:unnamed protein product, partial [Linum tenue]